MHFRFCSVTTLGEETRKYIYDKMTWPHGEMRQLLKDRRPRVRLCLLYNGQLATWASLGSRPMDSVFSLYLFIAGGPNKLFGIWAIR